MVRLLLAAFALVFALGCPILDELDKGAAEMDKYSPSARKAAEEKKQAAKAQPSGAPGKAVAGATDAAKQAASEWWGKARTLAPDEADESIVRCILPGGEQFMARHDCQMRSGIAKTN